jgi:hypothetical protein
MALGAIALRLERCAAGTVAGSARGLVRFGRLVQTRFKIQRSLGVLLEQLVMTDSAIAVGSLQVRGVIEGYVPVLGDKREFCRRSFLILGKNPKRSTQSDSEKTHEESSHAKKVAFLQSRLNKAASSRWVSGPMDARRRARLVPAPSSTLH